MPFRKKSLSYNKDNNDLWLEPEFRLEYEFKGSRWPNFKESNKQENTTAEQKLLNVQHILKPKN